ncbi:hypothetical protein NQ317_017258 [Molorchus minor]|uniref:Uncharacterized protein n=1 Tax=Molorchus minor TaxID=1323400 RepID=A0ABQ9JSB5_9CUCU|nr:hypothetical protein NQ317_017258 [Molorchus minor]
MLNLKSKPRNDQKLSAVACGSNSARDLVSFFRIPSEYDNHKQFNKLASERRKAWINRLKRADLTESKNKKWKNMFQAFYFRYDYTNRVPTRV